MFETPLKADGQEWPSSFERGVRCSDFCFGVTITEDTLSVDLVDGRTISIPLAWYPRLLHGSPEERQHWRMIGDGQGIHWEHLDEDIRVEGLLAGRPSGESEKSLKRWLEKRTTDAPKE